LRDGFENEPIGLLSGKASKTRLKTVKYPKKDRKTSENLLNNRVGNLR